ncbi:hypothetical protein [Nocardioides sp. LS1]|uniref:hypothetical protein n=1 Tax=Nocardioides sp. LS1 TaxID=1027620 RepID=UPI000F61CD29|nr:hypothetical protein [Nocardioides sp. LS1]GCD89877.1 hypothetical protein NLS1_18830 [Nocardioides sp. LS1]
MSERTGTTVLDDLDDKYDRMLRLADLFEASGDEMRARAKLGAEVLADPDVADSAELSRPTWAQAEGDVRAATTGRHGLLSRSVELDADALIVRATVLTYRWIDELQDAAYKTLGSIAGRAVGYLAPGVALGGAIVSAGLIETDALDRDGVASYLGELAENNPELMDHVTSGGGGLLDGLQMRSLLTTAVLHGESGRLAARAGLRAAGIVTFVPDPGAALRDVAGALVEPPASDPAADPSSSSAPASLEDLMATLAGTESGVSVQKVSGSRYIAYLPGPHGGSPRRLRLVSGDHASYAAQVVRALESATDGDPAARVMLVGSAQGGALAAELAAAEPSDAFVIEQVVTAGAPSAQVPRIPETTRVLSLEDRADPVAVLGSLVNAAAPHRLTVVFDGGPSVGAPSYVAGGRAADRAAHPELRAEIGRLQELGYLAG